ncbi:MAG: FixH family protein [Desulfarculus sp.]|nr:FixH family protein [Desulfarculus sp.]
MRLIRPAQALLLSLALLAAGCAATAPTPAPEAPAPSTVGANAPLEHTKSPVVRTPMTEKPLGPVNNKAAQRAEAQTRKATVAPQPAEKPAPAARAAKGKPAPLPDKGKTKAAQPAEKAKTTAGKPPKDLNLDKARLSQNSLFKVSYQPQPAQTQAKRPQEWKIKVLNKAGKPVTGAKVRLSGASPQNGHKLSPASLEATNLGHGYYRAKGLVFSQPGWWVVTVEVNNQGKGDRAQFNLLLK